MPFARAARKPTVPPAIALSVVALAAAALTIGTAAPARAGEHTVGEGENLTVIAARYCTSVRELARRNSVADPNLIHVGRRLDVADRCGTTPSQPRPARAVPPSDQGAGSGASTGGVPDGVDEIGQLLHLVPFFRAAAGEFQVPLDLLMALTFTESRWRSDRVSRDGAVGIGQLLPETASWLRDLMAEPDLDENDPGDNVRMSARLLRFLIDRTATSAGVRTRVALAAYFQGIGDVLRNGVNAGGHHYADVVLAKRPLFASL